MAKATAEDRAHFRRIAAASARIEHDRQQLAASEDPAAKIEEALRLSNAMLRLRDVPAPAEPDSPAFSLVERWRRAQKQVRRDSPRG
jgi:hypothetical protein